MGARRAAALADSCEGVVAGNNSGAQRGNGIWLGYSYRGFWHWMPLPCVDPTGAPTACPSAFTKIRYDQQNPERIYASSPAGFFVSDRGGPFAPSPVLGQTGQSVTDFAIDGTKEADLPYGRIYAAVQGVGIAISTNGGYGFTNVTSPIASLPANLFQYVKIALAPNNPSVLYASINSGSDDFNGVYVSHDINSTNPGWSETGMQGCQEADGCLYRGGIDNFMRSQNGHDGAIAVNPTDENVVIAGGAANWITTTGGGVPTQLVNCSSCPPINGWTATGDAATGPVHEDVHAIAFNPAGDTAYLGTDGGIFVSFDGGTTWLDNFNTIPVMNSEGVSVLGNTILSASWDVGLHWSFDHGGTWQSSPGADNDATDVLATEHAWFAARFGPPMNIWKSTDQGADWQQVVSAVTQPTPIVSCGRVQAFTVGNSVGPGNGVDGIWMLDDGAGDTVPYGYPFPDPNDDPQAVTVATFRSAYWVIAGSFAKGGSATLNLQISRNDGGPWREIGANLPTGSNGIYAVKRDAESSSSPLGPTIYVLTKTGRVFADSMADLVGEGSPSWIEITGNLTAVGSANVRFKDLAIDPVRGAVIVATDIGLFKTTNSCVQTVQAQGGPCWPTQWQSWGEGLPLVLGGPSAVNGSSVAMGVNALDGETRNDGHFYVYAAVWGRGVWVRDATADDP